MFWLNGETVTLVADRPASSFSKLANLPNDLTNEKSFDYMQDAAAVDVFLSNYKSPVT